MVITLKIEDNNGEKFEYNIFPVELTRELLEEHIDKIQQFSQSPAAPENKREEAMKYVLANFKYGHKVIFNDDLPDNELLHVFSSVEDTVANLVLVHKVKNNVK